MNKIIEMDLGILIDQPAQSEGIIGTIFYSEIMDIESEPEWETSTDSNAALQQNDIEDTVIIGKTVKDVQSTINANVNELIKDETDKDIQFQRSSIHTNVNEINTKEVDKEITLKESLGNGNASVAQNSISESESKAPPIAVGNCRLPKIKFTTLLKLKQKSNKEIIEYCMELGLIASKFVCPNCGSNMIFANNSEVKDGYVWYCSGNGEKSHKNNIISRTIRTGSFLSASQLTLLDTLLIIHCWVYKLPCEWTSFELSKTTCTLLEWSDFCRDVCVEICARDCSKIGGTGTIVEIEGGEYERRKDDKNTKDSFVFVGTENMYGDKSFLKIVETCDKNSFLEVIKSSVLPGSTVISEFCSKFKCRRNLEFVDLAKTCKYKFKDPKSSDLSKRKKFWDVIRRKLPRCNTYGYFDQHIAEYLWRKRNSSAYDIMRRFLLHIKTIYPPPTFDE